MKNKIKNFALGLGWDDVGFAGIENYQSPRSPKMEAVFPQAQTIIVGVTKEASHCLSPDPFLRGLGRDVTIKSELNSGYRLVRFLEKECRSSAMIIPSNYFLNMAKPASGFIGEVSLRHAAIAAGLGTWGRNNLVVHPKYGSQIFLTGILTDLRLEPDRPLKDELCVNCDLCVERCPVQALNRAHFTDTVKCIKNTQPHGMAGLISFWRKFSQAEPEEQKKMVTSESFMQLNHTLSFGMHYYCFNCYTSCPIADHAH